jgi:hypothetical protein
VAAKFARLQPYFYSRNNLFVNENRSADAGSFYCDTCTAVTVARSPSHAAFARQPVAREVK